MDDPTSVFRRITSKRLLCDELASGTLSEVAPQRHPLGFFAFIGTKGADTTLRMHYWPPEAKMAQFGFEIHDHQYDIDSHVFSGTLVQTTFELIGSGRPTHAVYAVDYDGEKSGLGKTGQHVAVQADKPELFDTGTSYRLPAGTFHLATAASEIGTVTLVLARNAYAKARVLGPLDGPDRVVFDRGTVSNSEALALRRDIVHVLRDS